ncbi:MAG: CsbD family protein [Planctomycetaceae bacterium]
MITRQELEGQWNQVKGQVQERWGEFGQLPQFDVSF